MAAPSPPATPRPAAVALAVVSAALVALPFLVVHVPPAMDLPQHVAQIRLLLAALHGQGDRYVVQWGAPNTLVYAVVGAAWAVAAPLAAGRVALLALALLWVAATAWLAHRRGRSPEAAALAALLVFNHDLYAGFLNFLVGWPCFALWLGLAAPGSSPPRTPARTALGLAAVAGLLYLAHVLWLAVACAWLAIETAVARPPRSVVAVRAAAAAPALLVATGWFVRLRALRVDAGFDLHARWVTTPWERLRPGWVVGATFGGLQGPVEPALCVLLVAWVALGYATDRAGWRARLDAPLSRAAGLLLGVGLFAPEKYMSTVQFASRWVPVAATLGVLGLPAPRLRAALTRTLAVGAAALFAATTAAAWVAFERDELDGLEAALARLPEHARVVGLDYVWHSAVVAGTPFVQTFAYAQVLRGAELNFTFAAHGSSLVRLRDPRPPPWTPGLEWVPEHLQPGDLRWFSHLLVNALPATHAQLRPRAGFVPVTTAGRWRLYESHPVP